MTLRGPLTDQRADLIAERLPRAGPTAARQAARPPCDPGNYRPGIGRLARDDTTERLAASRHPATSRIVARHKDGTRVRYELVDRHIVPLLERAESSLAHHLGQLTEQIKPGPSVGGFRLVNRRHPGPPRIEGPSLAAT